VGHLYQEVFSYRLVLVLYVADCEIIEVLMQGVSANHLSLLKQFIFNHGLSEIEKYFLS